MQKEILDSNGVTDLKIKGKRPYKEYGGVPVHPVGSQDNCKKCGVCVEQCPADAIDASTPWTTDPNKCISCGRCITVAIQAGKLMLERIDYLLDHNIPFAIETTLATRSYQSLVKSAIIFQQM